MLDQPAVTVGNQDVAIAAEMVEPDMGDDGEVRRDVRRVAGERGEQHVGDVVSDHGLDVYIAGDVPGDTAEERRDLRPPAHRLHTTDLEDAVRAERLREAVEPAGVARPVGPSERVADLLTGDQIPRRPRRKP